MMLLKRPRLISVAAASQNVHQLVCCIVASRAAFQQRTDAVLEHFTWWILWRWYGIQAAVTCMSEFMKMCKTSETLALITKSNCEEHYSYCINY